MTDLARYHAAKRAVDLATTRFEALCLDLQARRDRRKACLTSPQDVDYCSNQTANLLETANVP